MIKTLQASTRYMHVICTSTKLDSDLALASFVPMLKKSLEATVYRYTVISLTTISREAITTKKTGKIIMLIGYRNLHQNFETFILNRSRE